MANEIEEVRYQVGEAWKGEYNAETPYGVAAVVQDPTGLSVYRSLKNGNTGHPLSDSNWWFCIIDMSSIKEASDNVDALNTRVTEAEDERVEAENNRVTAENNRVTAEGGRVTAESERTSSENSRKTAENARATAETNRVTAEATRANAESGRVSAEQSRVLAESLRDSAESSRATAETNRAAAESERHTQYTADHSTATSDHTTAQLDHTTAVADHEQASTDHTASVEATDKASNVNAEIDGLVVTITDRNGQSHSVNIGFDIAGTYASVAAMNADAANVQEGAFVMIATSDPTSAENARLYVRNSTAPTSSEPFTFLSDLDQAATSAWADWMENYKPTIIADHQRAETDHTTAAADHTAAVSDHNTATTDHTQAASDHSTAAADHTAAASDHTRAESDHTTAAADHTQAETDHQRAETDHNTMEPRIANLEESKANKDGYYSQMTVGAAETLVGETVDSEAYLIRPTGGESNEVANGVASVLGMEGNSAVWNQFAATDNVSRTVFGVTFTRANRKIILSGTATANGQFYVTDAGALGGLPVPKGNKGIMEVRYISGEIDGTHDIQGTGGVGHFTDKTSEKKIFTAAYYAYLLIYFEEGTVFSDYSIEYNLFDLTLMFGAGNEPSTVEEFEAWLAKNVGLKPYYAYNAGTILSAQTLGIKTYGQNLLNPTTRQAKLIPYEWEDNSNVYTIKNVPSGATATFTPDATGVAVTVDISGGSLNITSYGSGILELSAATADTYVCMKWDEGKDDDVVPFEEHTQTFDVRKVYGKVSGAGEYVQCFPNGLRGIGSIKDTLTASEAVSKIGSVDMSTMPWVVSTDIFDHFVASVDKKLGVYNLVCGKYPISTAQNWTEMNNKEISGSATALFVIIRDESYSTADELKASLNDVPLYYELATPITYTDLIYRDGGIDTPLSDVLFNIEVDNWSIEEQLLTPYEDGNPTAIPATISSQYGMDAVEEIDTIKHTYVSSYTEQNFSDSQKAQARRNIGAVEADGSYPNMSVGLAKNLAGENAVEAEYTYRQSGGTIGTDTGIANVTTAKGKSLVWNQLVQNGNFANGTTNWQTVNGSAEVSSGVLTFTCTSANTNSSIRQNNDSKYKNTHKFFVSGMVKPSVTRSVSIYLSGHWITAQNVDANIWHNIKGIVNGTGSNGEFGVYPFPATPAVNDTCDIKNINVIDLTKMFGAGNEPSTVEEFEALYPLDYYDYNAGTLINNNTSAIETTGFNQWDEEWEIGEILSSNGTNYSSTTIWRSKNYISVLPNTTYFAYSPSSSNKYIRGRFYDANHNYIGPAPKSGDTRTGNTFTTPDNAYYMRFAPNVADIPNHDICINLSDPAKNGTYEPYENHTFYFDKVLQSSGSLATVTGKLNGEGESVVVFPDGMKSAGNVFDEIKGNVAIKRIGSVDLGSLSWNYDASNSSFYAANIPFKETSDVWGNIGVCSKYKVIIWDTLDDKFLTFLNTNKRVYIKDSAYTDAATFKTAMSGVMLYYELATPETYLLDQTVTGGYQVNALGTEQRLPEDTASAVNAPVHYSVIYPVDAVGTITKLPINYISEGSLTNFTTELASKLGTFLNATIGINATYNQTNQEYDYSITITANE